jgi:D-alanine-D-alanine ligase
MHIAILHPAISDDASLEDQDTLYQAKAIDESLRRQGHDVRTIACTLDLEQLKKGLTRDRPDVVFNLVESLDGTDSLIGLVPALLDHLGIPYTGNRTESFSMTTQKVVAKQAMYFAGIPTAPWYDPVMGDSSELALWPRATPGIREDVRLVEGDRLSESELLAAPCIVKANWEHASRGMDDRNVLLTGDHERVRELVASFQSATGRPFFAERYIEGREFTIAMLEGPGGVQVLPPREIAFGDYPPGKPRIFCHRAKWVESSFEYDNTTYTFDIAPQDQELVGELCRLAEDCWKLFSLRGYARIDLRVDLQGRPWILEVTCNPCLSPESGFSETSSVGGIEYDGIIGLIVDAALRHASGHVAAV